MKIGGHNARKTHTGVKTTQWRRDDIDQHDHTPHVQL